MTLKMSMPISLKKLKIEKKSSIEKRLTNLNKYKIKNKEENYIDPTLELEWENIKEFRKKREDAIIKTLKEVLLPKS